MFDLQGMPRQKQHEAAYITPYETRPRAAVVPGGRATAEAPFADWQCGALRRAGIESVALATGPGGDTGPLPQDVTALAAGSDAAGALLALPETCPGTTVVLSADAYVEPEPLRRLATSDADIAVLVDVSGTAAGHRPDALLLAISSVAGASRRLAGTSGGEVLAAGTGDAEFAGAATFSADGFAALRRAAEKHLSNGTEASLGTLLADLLAEGHRIGAVEIASGWLELRTEQDVARAAELLAGEATQ